MTESEIPKEGSLIVVDGATGYLGSHLVSTLIQRGYRVRCLVRSINSMDSVESIELIEVDYSKEIDPALLSGARALVHLIGSIAPRKGESLNGLHRG
ncbi:MAG TPA: NAD(P)H-binding protein, partial [Candidatus Melainabacteria bacterium]|nr:NAD(P)H-binding protein [Candidatus Melainabacteria bacterium]